jgi:hypothetical protein
MYLGNATLLMWYLGRAMLLRSLHQGQISSNFPLIE